MIVEVEVTVARPAPEVFDVMADVRNEPRWNSQVSSAELTSGEPIGAGSVFHTVNRGQPYNGRITEYERPDRLTFAVSGRRLDILASMELTEVPGGTQLTGRFELSPRGPMKLMMAVMSPLIRRDFSQQLASFKELCEARGGTDDVTGQ